MDVENSPFADDFPGKTFVSVHIYVSLRQGTKWRMKQPLQAFVEHLIIYIHLWILAWSI